MNNQGKMVIFFTGIGFWRLQKMRALRSLQHKVFSDLTGQLPRILAIILLCLTQLNLETLIYQVFQSWAV